MRMLATVATVLFSLALFGCPDKKADPDPSATKPATTATGAGSAHPAASASAKGGW